MGLRWSRQLLLSLVPPVPPLLPLSLPAPEDPVPLLPLAVSGAPVPATSFGHTIATRATRCALFLPAVTFAVRFSD